MIMCWKTSRSPWSRTELGTVATSLREYAALHGVSRREGLIGRENAELVGEGKGVAQPGMPLHDRKIGLRDII